MFVLHEIKNIDLIKQTDVLFGGYIPLGDVGICLYSNDGMNLCVSRHVCVSMSI